MTTNRTRAQKAGLSAAMIAAALAAAYPVAGPMIDKWENGGKGPILVPYDDGAGFMTVCSGVTIVKMRTYTAAECKAIDKAVYNDFGTAVLRCTPGIYNRVKTLAASIVLAINIGKAGYCRSTVARRFNEGLLTAGCNAFLMWNRVGGKVWRGLDNRRRDERALCLQGVAAPVFVFSEGVK